MSFDSTKLHNGDGLTACVEEAHLQSNIVCAITVQYKKGKTQRATIDMTPYGSQGNGENGNNADSSSVSIAPGSSSPSNGQFLVPEKVTISKGGSVIWTNDDDSLHTVTSGSPEDGNSGMDFDSSYISAGKTFEHTFNSEGTFDYYCSLHPFMKGKIVVK